MQATIHDIVKRQRSLAIKLADVEDFDLRAQGQIPAKLILENAHITLYSLDFENRQAIFVETPASVDLSQAPFYYLAQFENAIRVLTIDFDTMLELSQSVTVDDSRLIMIHSVGRAGSTLASQIFAQIQGVVNISEPDVLTILVQARYSRPDKRAELKVLLQAAVALLCKTPAPTAWVIKGRSFVIELGDWLDELYPRTKNLFLYRHADSWLQSSLRAFIDNIERTDDERREMNNAIRSSMAPLVPLIAEHDVEQPLSVVGILTLMWLSVMERYVHLHDSGIEMLAIRYANWRTIPQQTAVAMLDYCQCVPADLGPISAALTRDSQAGTYLSRNAVGKYPPRISEVDRGELAQHLQNHAFIHDVDYEVPKTLKL